MNYISGSEAARRWGLSERSVRSGSMPQKVPDFTRGAWKTAKPLGLVDVDLEKLGLDASGVKKDSSALNV